MGKVFLCKGVLWNSSAALPGLWEQECQRSKPRTHSQNREKIWTSLVAQLVKNLPATREAWVQSLGWEDPLEKGKATHSSILV